MKALLREIKKKIHRKPPGKERKLGSKSMILNLRNKYPTRTECKNKNSKKEVEEDGGNVGGSGVHFPSTPGKYLADLRSRANSQQYSSIYEDQRPKIEDIERSDGKKSA